MNVRSTHTSKTRTFLFSDQPRINDVLEGLLTAMQRNWLRIQELSVCALALLPFELTWNPKRAGAPTKVPQSRFMLCFCAEECIQRAFRVARPVR